MTRHTTLVWIERLLLVVGVILAAWSAVTIIEARYYATLRPPLPGETPGEARPRSAIIQPGSWIARLDAPSIGLSATVIEGSEDATLSRAAGHIENTALPGEGGNIGIAGHSDTIFRPVRKLQVGDLLTLTSGARVYTYRVTGTRIVAPDDVEVLDPAGHPTLTLVTCYPFTFIGHAPKRFVVFADLISEQGKTSEAGK
jgi:sortase A